VAKLFQTIIVYLNILKIVVTVGVTF